MSFLRVLRPLAALAALACSSGESAPANAPAATVAASAPADSALDPAVARADSSRIQGSATAPVWVLEVSDYQCPFCKRWHDETYPQLVREYVNTGKIRLAYVNFPLTSMHPHAQLAAEAAMCAGSQGKYWPYHDGLFATQERWEGLPDARAVFDSLATAAGLDSAAFATCLSSHAMREIVAADQARMEQAGVRATPTFFIGNTKLEGAQPIEAFRQAIDAALSDSTSAPPAGRP
ncbi:MAG TPA: DsbA family protein [Gemmatimonadaceae bacterium]|nr:DsbA family protein [Gemmatimonadaceae bacterium]